MFVCVEQRAYNPKTVVSWVENERLLIYQGKKEEMANPRKFSEKIALHKQRQAEEQAR